MCFVFIWEHTATCATYSINWLVFITEMKSVYSAVRTGSLNKAVRAYAFKGLNLLPFRNKVPSYHAPFLIHSFSYRSWGSSVDTVTKLKAWKGRNPPSTPSKEKTFVFSPRCPKHSGSHSPSLLCKGSGAQYLQQSSRHLKNSRRQKGDIKFHSGGPQISGATVHHGDMIPDICTPLQWKPGHLSQEVQQSVQDADRLPSVPKERMSGANSP